MDESSDVYVHIQIIQLNLHVYSSHTWGWVMLAVYHQVNTIMKLEYLQTNAKILAEMVVTLATDTFLRPFGKTCFRFHFLNVALNVDTGLMIRVRWNFCWKSTFQNFWFYSEPFCNGNKKCFYCSFDDYLWWRAEGFAADFQFGEGKNSNKRDADNFLNHEARIFTKRETKQWQETRGVDFLTMTLSCAKVETTAVQNNAPALRSTYEILINNGATHCSYPKWK